MTIAVRTDKAVETISVPGGAQHLSTDKFFTQEDVEALAADPQLDIRIFGKPSTRRNRRMGVVVGYAPHGSDLDALRDRVKAAAAKVRVVVRK